MKTKIINVFKFLVIKFNYNSIYKNWFDFNYIINSNKNKKDKHQKYGRTKNEKAKMDVQKTILEHRKR